MAVSHVKSNTIADFTGTFTGFNSQGSTTTIAATDIVRPSDWNSGHNQFYTLQGNTTGNSTASGTDVIFAGSGGIFVGGSTGTVVISNYRHSGFNPFDGAEHVISSVGNGTLLVRPFRAPNFAFDRFAAYISNTNSSNSSGSHTLSFWYGLYTRNASTLSLLHSASASYAITHSGTAGSYSLFSGLRRVTAGFTTTITEGQYWLAAVSNSTSGGANGTYSQAQLSNATNNFFGDFSSSHNTLNQFTLGLGQYTATTSGMPASIAFTQLRGSEGSNFKFPIIHFISSTV